MVFGFLWCLLLLKFGNVGFLVDLDWLSCGFVCLLWGVCLVLLDFVYLYTCGLFACLGLYLLGYYCFVIAFGLMGFTGFGCCGDLSGLWLYGFRSSWRLLFVGLDLWV